MFHYLINHSQTVTFYTKTLIY